MTARGGSGSTATRCAPALAAVAFALAAITALAAPPLGAVESAAAPPTPAWSATEERAALGLRAFADGQFDRAAELLATAEPPAELADWCLWALAEARAARAELAPSRAAIDELLAARPDSPLRPRALVRRLELAIEAGDPGAAKPLLAAARAEHLPGAERVALEKLAWRLALDTADTPLLVETARRLLVLAPLDAANLRVVDTVAARKAAAPDWRLWLAPAELERRAEALLEVDLPAGALTTLAAVPVERRDLAWRILEARALIAAERGAAAYAALAGVQAPAAAPQAELEWERARAAAEAATPRRGRALDAAASERWTRLAREHLLAAARGGVRDLAARALERLATGYLDDQRPTEAVAALRQHAALQPESTALARPLWEHGWSAYERGESERAIALWRDLAAIYPRTAAARSGRYWTARALEQGGDPAAARELYREILAADTADFYARQAALRLAGAERTTADAPPERERWPTSPLLARAAKLSDWGLDRLAHDEIELVAARVEPRAVAALRAVVLARAGERRASLGALREAFPRLGTAHQAQVPAEAITLFYPIDYRDAIARAATRERLSPSLVFAMIHQESAFDAAARSRSGARGLMQLMPTTGQEVARRLGLPFSTARLSDPETSLRLGTHYFRQMLDRFDGNVELALAGYNGGPGRISRLWRAAGPAPELDRFLEGLVVTESRNYVKRILVLAESYRSLYPDLG